ncbi:Uncharacterized protein dnm_034560 [Desulfonema magnum]|uniref:Uncharacterized protein n=1 Tax=Desulfonema magnum TaxID=45655 RepID=A0A975BLN3_9BACT|nr:Uncharacterized protein dnm_034560 [Desulfonema magnum]
MVNISEKIRGECCHEISKKNIEKMPDISKSQFKFMTVIFRRKLFPGISGRILTSSCLLVW